jgi:predicted GNAT family acetyltransferase
MMLERFDDPQRFAAHVMPTLETHEAHNNLILGILENVCAGDYNTRDVFMAVLRTEQERRNGANGRIDLVVLRTPPHPVLLSYAPEPPSPLGIAALTEALYGRYGVEIGGITGDRTAARPVADAWAERTGSSVQVHMALRIYAATDVTPVEDVPGTRRWARERDRPLLRDWIRAFHRDALGEDPSQEQLERTVGRYLTSGADRRGLMLWEDGDEIVSMAGYSGPTPHGIRINAVYTPPKFRGRGYAGACVATLSRTLLDDDRAFCFLFTDLANPTSNKLYKRIGYRPVGDVQEWRFA